MRILSPTTHDSDDQDDSLCSLDQMVSFQGGLLILRPSVMNSKSSVQDAPSRVADAT